MEELFAYTVEGPGGGTVEVPSRIPFGGVHTLEKIIGVGFSIFLGIIVILALFFLIFGAIQWSTSSGDKQNLDSARKKIIYSIIGLLVALFAFFIISVFAKLFGFNLLGMDVF